MRLDGFSGSLYRCNRIYDILIGAATANIARHIALNVFATAGLLFTNASNTRHDLSGRALPTLHGIIDHKGLLQGVQFIAVGQPFYGRDRFSIVE